MTQWLLIRHGESSANANGILSGWLDVPLTQKGREQAIQVGAQLVDFDIDDVWSSDLQRATETAKLAMKNFSERTGKQTNLFTTPAFRERSFGPLQGRDKNGLKVDGSFEDLQQWSPQISGIEGFLDLARRVLKQMDLCQKSGTNVLFAHGGVIRLIYGLVLNLSQQEIATFHIDNATPIIVKSPNEGWKSYLKELS